MNIVEFMQLPAYEDLTQLTDATLGMKFLTGQKVVLQKETKEIGHVATYYVITDVDPKNPKRFSYTTKMETLTRPTEVE